MKIGVVGSGIVAQVLGAGFLGERHEVALGTRDPRKLAQWQAANPGGCVGGFDDSAGFGEIVALAAMGGVAMDALLAAGADRLAGKVVVDATNPIADAPRSTACCGSSPGRTRR